MVGAITIATSCCETVWRPRPGSTPPPRVYYSRLLACLLSGTRSLEMCLIGFWVVLWKLIIVGEFEPPATSVGCGTKDGYFYKRFRFTRNLKITRNFFCFYNDLSNLHSQIYCCFQIINILINYKPFLWKQEHVYLK